MYDEPFKFCLNELGSRSLDLGLSAKIIKVTKILLELEVDPKKYINHFGKTALTIAFKAQDPELVELIVQKGVEEISLYNSLHETIDYVNKMPNNILKFQYKLAVLNGACANKNTKILDLARKTWLNEDFEKDHLIDIKENNKIQEKYLAMQPDALPLSTELKELFSIYKESQEIIGNNSSDVPMDIS